jgi:hypothetical protein
LQEWTLDSVIEYYSKFGKDHANYSDYSAGMVHLIEHLKITEDLPKFKPNVVKLGLFLGLTEIPENIPGWFNKGIAILWREPNQYVISLGFHEQLVVPEEKAIETVKHQLLKAQKIAGGISLSSEEMQEWDQKYRRKNREDIEFLYSNQPHEWLLSNVSLDLQNLLNALRQRVSNFHYKFAQNQLDEATAKTLFDEFMDIHRTIQNILQVAEEIDSKYQTTVYLKENHH